MKKQTIKKSMMAAAALLLSFSAMGAESLRYNQARWKSSHNSYQKPQSLYQQLADHGIRSIELDLHSLRALPLPKKSPRGDWFVMHSEIDPGASCELFSECLAEIGRFHRDHPDHQVITIWFDLKDRPLAGRGRIEFSEAIRRGLPEGSVFEPVHLMDACPEAENLKQSVTREGCAWPLLADLRGKFILVVCEGADDLVRQGYSVREDAAFLAVRVHGSSDLAKDPNRVFYNMPGPNPFGGEVLAGGYVGRAYGLNREDDFQRAKKIGFHHLATDNIDAGKFPWAETVSEFGPFEPIADD